MRPENSGQPNALHSGGMLIGSMLASKRTLMSGVPAPLTASVRISTAPSKIGMCQGPTSAKPAARATNATRDAPPESP